MNSCTKPIMYKLFSNDFVINRTGVSVIDSFEPTVILEHEAIIGGFKCLYWLMKNEIAHHTNYPKLLSLAMLLGCDYFEKLKVTSRD